MGTYYVIYSTMKANPNSTLRKHRKLILTTIVPATAIVTAFFTIAIEGFFSTLTILVLALFLMLFIKVVEWLSDRKQKPTHPLLPDKTETK
jgi:ABC-type transport system involved in cytochrome bd biosynthesis fused ATPase/permease subunit